MPEYDTESLIRNSPIEFQEILLEYYEYLKRRAGKGNINLADTTIYAKIYIIARFFKDKGILPPQMTVQNIEEFLTTFKSRGSYLSRLKTFIKFAYRKGWISEKLKADIDELELKNINERKNIHDPATRYKFAIPYEKWSDLYKQCEGHPQKLFTVWLMLNFGLRRAEVINLKVENIDLKNKRLHIFESKTENGVRSFPLLPDQIRIFKEYLQKRKDAGITNEFLIYSRRSKNQMSGNLLYQWINSLSIELQDNGIAYTRKLRPHVLRYSYATHLWKITGDLYAVSRLLGHSSIQITEKYLSLAQDELFTRCETALKTAFA